MEISVIIPVYNAAPFLEKAVESALKQEETAEVILIEDGSIDDSLTLCRELTQKYIKVRLLQHDDKGNHGPGRSRNLGIQNAQSQYISFLDADDFYLPNRFKVAKAIFEGNEFADGIYERMDMFFESKEAEQQFRSFYPNFNSFSVRENVEPENLLEELLTDQECAISICGITVKRSFIIEKEIVFLEQVRMWEEIHFLFDCFTKGQFYGGQLRQPVLMRRAHMNNMSYNKQVEQRDKVVFQKIWLDKTIVNNFSKLVNRYFFKAYLTHQPIVKRFEQNTIMRYFFKSIIALTVILRKPKVLFKII